MYKQKLQELCQRRQWALPLYTCAKDGPDHNPRFWASVTVDGATFDCPQDAPSRTSKEAQNEAARVAFHHFVPSAPPPPPPPAAAPSPAQPSSSSSARIDGVDNPAKNEELKGQGSDYLYKTQLQSYAQKKSLNLPTYDHIREGSLHAPRFKALVTVDGQIFESPQFFSTLKDAEHAAAKVALMSLSTVGNQEEECGIYKNLLQELAQKEGLTLPTYQTVGDGPSHMPTFVSTIEIEGENFQGNAAKTRKQAENNAAKVAWTRLRERNLRRLPRGFSSRFQILDVSDASSSLASMDSLLPKASQPPVLCTNHDEEDNMETAESKDESIDVHVISSLPDDEGAHVSEEMGGSGNDKSTECLQKPNSPEKRGQSPSLLSSDAVYARLRDPFLEESVSSDDEISSVPPPSKHLVHSSADGASECPAESGDISLLCNRVRVYPRRPDFKLSPGTNLLPFSDEMWVAVSVETSSEGSIPV